ncbi:MAG: hypothetical protein L6Q76_33795, partial [Polyangiaceae bacterium]|nr:hypothetical protein [Polyangiaceae bacterium]
EGGVVGELKKACSPPLASWLVLLDNDWGNCVVDGVRIGQDGGWQGLEQVCPGRHAVVTQVGAGTAVLDTLVHPGRMHAFRLDRSSAAWIPVAGPQAESLVQAVNAGRLRFHNYFSMVAEPRLLFGLAAPQEDVLTALGSAFVHLVGRLDQGEPPANVAPDAMRLGRTLIGLPMDSFARIADAVGGMAWERSAAGRRDLSRLVTQLGLAWLPGEPSLLASLAGLDADEGRWDEALALAKQARPYANKQWSDYLDALFARAPRS